MLASERRIAPRFLIKVPLRITSFKALAMPQHAIQSMNLSTRGVYFATDLPLRQGQLVQVLLQMPKEIGGKPGEERCFTGRVAHVHANLFANRMSGVGVHFLHYEEIALQLSQREQEISEARSIQKRLLPKEIPQLSGYEIATAWRSARVVGGDYFDVLRLGNDALGLCIADVAGKGLSAALLMSNLQAAVRSLGSSSLLPHELCLRLNAQLCGSMAEDRFITFFYAHLDGSARQLHYVNAGHNPPIMLHRDGSHDRLEEGGGILGVFRDQTFVSASLQLRSGDLLTLFTDGITEASDGDEEEFGERRFLDLLKALRASSPVKIQAEIMTAVAAFSGSNWHDDATLLILRVA